MNKQKFWDDYRDSQTKINMSDDLKRTIIASAQKQKQEGSATPDPTPEKPVDNLHNTGIRNTGSDRAFTPRKRVLRIALPAAACLAVLAIFAGALSFIGNGATETPESVIPDFAVKAYAAGTDSILQMGTENQIIFTREDPMSGVDPENYLTTEGYYTGCLFQVEGSDITQIQASVSRGVLYRTTSEYISLGENPDQWNELISWKPSSRGLGEYYNVYDDVQIWGPDNDLPKDSPDQQWRVSLSKKLGSTIDIPITNDSSEYRFGFWTNDDYGWINADQEPGDAIIDLFDGETLTVTVTFADGHTTTQIIELHAGDVRSSLEQDENGEWITHITTELIDSETTDLERYADYTHILYGTIKETNHEAFPGSLENANELEDIVGEPYSFEQRELTYPVQYEHDGEFYDATLAENDIHPANDTLASVYGDYMDASDHFFSIGNVSFSKTKTLPEGISLNDLESGMGSWEYFNRVVNQVDGYTLDEAGTPSEGFSWVVLEATMTNTSSSSKDLSGEGGSFGTFATQDDKGRVFEVRCRSFALLNGGWDTSKPGEYADIAVDPGESTTVRWLVVAPDFALDDPSLVYLTNYEKNLEGFEVNF